MEVIGAKNFTKRNYDSVDIDWKRYWKAMVE